MRYPLKLMSSLLKTGIGNRRYCMPPFPEEIREEIDQIPYQTMFFSFQVMHLERSADFEETKSILYKIANLVDVIKSLQSALCLAEYSERERGDYARVIAKLNDTIRTINKIAVERNVAFVLISNGLSRTILLAETVRKHIVCGLPKGIPLDPFYWIEKMGIYYSTVFFPGETTPDLSLAKVRVYPNVGTPLAQLKTEWLSTPGANKSLDLFISLKSDKTQRTNLKKYVMHYFTDEELKTLEAVVEAGTIKMKMDTLLKWLKFHSHVRYQEYLTNLPPPVVACEPVSLSDGDYIFIITLQKKLYVAIKQKGVINHSCLNQGRPVFLAGEFTCKNGKVIAMTNWSGHYQNSGEKFANGLDYFQAHGLDLDALEQASLERATLTGRLPSIPLKAAGFPHLLEWIKARKKLTLLIDTYKRVRTTSYEAPFRNKINTSCAKYGYDTELTDSLAALFSRIKVKF